MEDYSKWLVPTAASLILGISRDRVRRLALRGKLESVHTPYGVLISPQSVQKLAKELKEQRTAEAHDEARSPAAV